MRKSNSDKNWYKFQIKRDIIEKVASKLLPMTILYAEKSDHLILQHESPDKQYLKECDVTCCDVTRSQLVTEVFEYMTANNPSTMWRTEREKKLLEAGLQALSYEQRETLRNERIFYKMEDLK